jgi:hypothetical protein
MKLWAVTIRAEIKFGDPRKSDNELILCADGKDEAEKRATKFFTDNGVSAGLKGIHFRRFEGEPRGPAANSRQTRTLTAA